MKRGLKWRALIFRVVQKVDGILIHILAAMVVPHHSLRITMTRHHLHLAVTESLLKGAGDGRAPEVMW